MKKCPKGSLVMQLVDGSCCYARDSLAPLLALGMSGCIGREDYLAHLARAVQSGAAPVFQNGNELHAVRRGSVKCNAHVVVDCALVVAIHQPARYALQSTAELLLQFAVDSVVQTNVHICIVRV